ncbi:hypothetical protein FH508_0017150 [Lysinibacillus sp. CD3-6]|uniref:hypothetical protein n=1 Tax=Lysinibacillus sp. CD3-6 TaxID=2892541 RepID=UPI001D17D1DF|nr:hypothetical protein [Lysinibacillus sp. CD3-6]UED79167.1 hypothetical protein FH508_0017150 [Lysinibacillus sp. CD3-6]
MKKKVIFAIGLTGVLAFTIGFVANLQNTQVSIEEKTIVASKQTNKHDYGYNKRRTIYG